MATEVKTDNSFFMDKVRLRLNHLPEKKSLLVLDAYSSDGLIWNKIKEIRPDIDFKVVRLDAGENKKGFYVRTDNVRFLSLTSLKKYDIIDLDAYGIPYKQLEIVFSQSHTFDKRVEIFVTANLVGMAKLPRDLLGAIGITKRMYAISPILCSKNPREKFMGYLGNRGVKKIFIRESTENNIHMYLNFSLGENRNASDLQS